MLELHGREWRVPEDNVFSFHASSRAAAPRADPARHPPGSGEGVGQECRPPHDAGTTWSTGPFRGGLPQADVGPTEAEGLSGRPGRKAGQDQASPS